MPDENAQEMNAEAETENGTDAGQEVNAQEATPEVNDNKPSTILSNPAKAETKPETKAEVPNATVPENYEFTLPDGFEFTKEQQKAFATQAKELGLTQDQANKMLVLSQQNQEVYKQAHKAQVKRWADEIRMDKDMGGGNFDSTVAYAKAALSKFDEDGQLYEMLNETGYGNHPVVIKLLSKLGKAHAEDKVILGNQKAEDKPLYERLYS